MIKEEVWKYIDNYSNKYKISNYGNIISYAVNQNGYKIKPRIDRYGYYKVALSKNGKRIYTTIHRLVAQTFIPNPENKPTVNHKDGNKLNNYVGNLEWSTNQENAQHAWNTGLQRKRFGKYNDKSKKVYQYDKNMNLLNTFESTRDVERKTGFDHSHIADCCVGKTKQAYGYIWKYHKESGD